MSAPTDCLETEAMHQSTIGMDKFGQKKQKRDEQIAETNVPSHLDRVSDCLQLETEKLT